jgi:DNA-binding transcriptional regulator YdaS (Cro superfamily)
MKPIEKAISIIGSQMKLAHICGVSQVTVHKWLNGANVKPEHALKIERALNGAVRKQDICPWFPWDDVTAA